MDTIIALVLTLLVNGTELDYPITYSNTLEECQNKSYRVIYILSQIEPEATNIVKAKCMRINVLNMRLPEMKFNKETDA